MSLSRQEALFTIARLLASSDRVQDISACVKGRHDGLTLRLNGCEVVLTVDLAAASVGVARLEKLKGIES